jgi:hypothetical protein
VRELLKRTVFLQALENGERISESDRKSALQEFCRAKATSRQNTVWRVKRAGSPDNFSGGSVDQRRADVESGGQHEKGSGAESCSQCARETDGAIP